MAFQRWEFTCSIAFAIILCVKLLTYQVNGQQTFTEYRLDFDGMLCSPISKNFGTVTTRISCAIKCDRDALCLGFFHSDAAMVCLGVDSMFTPLVGCSAVGVNSTFRFYRNSAGGAQTTTVAAQTTTTTTIITSTTTSTIMSPTTTTTSTTPPSTATNLYGVACVVDADCTLPNTGCIESTCQCAGGYKYYPSTASCVTDCAAYGDTFIKIPGYSMMAGSVGALPTGTTEKDCVAHCATLPDCRSVNYVVFETNCYFKSLVQYESPLDFGPQINCNHYVRNCA